MEKNKEKQPKDMNPSLKAENFKTEKEKEKKNTAEAPSREDWEGGGSHPEQENREKRNPPLPAAGGTNEIDEEDDEEMKNRQKRTGLGEEGQDRGKKAA